MEIKVISVSQPETVTKGKNTWQKIVVTYQSNKGTQTKNLVSFDKIPYGALQDAAPGSFWDINLVKEGENWQWKEVKALEAGNAVPDSQGEASTSRVSTQTAAPSRKAGDWETSEERAKKQVYIVRQSSIANAVSLLGVGVPVMDILGVASRFEDFVFGRENPNKIASKPDAKPVKRRIEPGQDPIV